MSKDQHFNVNQFKEKPRPPEWEREQFKRKVQKAKKKVRPNRDVKPPRRKDWMSVDLDALDDLDDLSPLGRERIMPRGERERRRAVLDVTRSIEEQHATPQQTAAEEIASGKRGIVVEVSIGLCRVDVGGEIRLCALRGSLSAEESGYTNVVAVGDEVIVSEDGMDVIERVLPRRSVLARPDVFYSHLKQVIVANVDQLLIVASWREPHLWPELIDRYLITAERDNLRPILCVNKIDLAEDRAVCEDFLRPYAELGLRIVYTSARTGEGIPALRELLIGHATVLAGLSGVGKSSLLSAVQPGLSLRVGAVSEQSRQGQHTTSQASLWRLGRDGFVVDTPGIREFGLSGLHKADLPSFYPEVVALAGQCRFGDCLHVHEPDCAVRAASEQGTFAAWRYHNYRKILETLPD